MTLALEAAGIKYKKCCPTKGAAPVASLNWQKMRRTEGELTHALLKHADKYYGQGAGAEAWDEFSLWSDVPMDPESEPELDTAFLPWFVFNWIPDNAEVDEAEHLPEMQVAMHYLEQKGHGLIRSSVVSSRRSAPSLRVQAGAA